MLSYLGSKSCPQTHQQHTHGARKKDSSRTFNCLQIYQEDAPSTSNQMLLYEDRVIYNPSLSYYRSSADQPPIRVPLTDWQSSWFQRGCFNTCPTITLLVITFYATCPPTAGCRITQLVLLNHGSDWTVILPLIGGIYF